MGELAIGIAAHGASWQSPIVAALRRLAPRITIRAVFDPVHSRAEAAARAFSASPATGLRRLASRDDLSGFVLLPLPYPVDVLADVLAAAKGPVLFDPRPWFDDLADAARARRTPSLTAIDRLTSRIDSPPLHPLLPLRFAPATIRLMELQAAHRGSLVPFELAYATTCEPAEAFVRLIQRIDLVSMVVAVPLSDWRIELPVDRSSNMLEAMERRISFICESSRHTIRIVPGPQDSFRFGAACSDAAPLVEWRAERDLFVNGLPEDLASDRNGDDLYADRFGRRLASGLIPIPTAADLIGQLVFGIRALGERDRSA